jgi:transposase
LNNSDLCPRTMPRVAPLPLVDRQRVLLEKWSRGGATPYRLVVRSRIILLSAQGFSDRRIARRLRINPITVARWKSRFRVLGVEGLRQEAPRLGSPPRLSKELVHKIVRMTLHQQPVDPPAWTTRSLARVVGVSHSTVRRIWQAYDLRPPRSRRAALARSSEFRPKAIDVVGLYVNPPRKALALSVRDPIEHMPVGPRAGGFQSALRAPIDRRSWGIDLLATLNLLDSSELKGSAPRYLDQEFLAFLQSVGRHRRTRERIVLLAEPSKPGAQRPLERWLPRHPEFSVQFTGEGTPLRQIVADFLEQGSSLRTPGPNPGSLPVLQGAIKRWARETGVGPRPFAWTRD